MIYRHATPEDAEAIARIHVAGWQVAYRGILADPLLNSLDVAQRTRDWQQRLADKSIDIFVAADNSGLCGFCACGSPRGTDQSSHLWELRSIYLLPKLRGKGIGKALFELAMESSRRHQATTMVLWVAEENTSARAFYASQGMTTDGVPHAHAVGDGAELQRVKYVLPLT